MTTNTSGIHHVTAIAGEPQPNVDEGPERLGETLKLPPWLGPQRDRLEEALSPLRVPAVGSR